MFYLQPHVRLYQQSAADFYTPFFVTGTEPLAGDSGSEASADYRLGELDCELLVDSSDAELTHELTQIVATEVWRIEQKFSRYRDDSILYGIHGARGRAVSVDEETSGLLNFAARCYQLSDGLFDITSGVLRKAWVLDGSDNIPSSCQMANTPAIF